MSLPPETAPTPARLAPALWWLLGYVVLVILWGALVRATGAGAGCGSHWPLCNGEVIPRSPTLETVIEFSHRLSSGLLGLLVLAATVAVFRSFPRGHGARKAVSWSLFFVVTEALIGAGLVRFEWVASNTSQERAYVMAFHLVNTFLLLGAMTMTAWLAAGGHALSWRGRRKQALALGLALAVLLVVGSSGAVTALGDTLVLTAGITPEESPLVAALVERRFYHPTLAVLAFLVTAVVALHLSRGASSSSRTYARAFVGLFSLQLLAGAINVLLRAPVWMQLLHLGLSDGLWVLLVLLACETLSRRVDAALA